MPSRRSPSPHLSLPISLSIPGAMTNYVKAEGRASALGRLSVSYGLGMLAGSST